MAVKEYKETHQQGVITIEGVPAELRPGVSMYMKGDLGVQIAEDGRVWICINGLAFLRFSPYPNGKMSKESLPKGESDRERWVRIRREHGKADNPELYDRGDVEP